MSESFLVTNTLPTSNENIRFLAQIYWILNVLSITGSLGIAVFNNLLFHTQSFCR